MDWTTAQIPALDGQLWVVTGANSGLGLSSARALAEHGATVVMACRDPKKAEAAELEVRRVAPGAKVTLGCLDLASLRSVEAFAKEVSAAHGRLDGLLNNAGVMATPRTSTADGFELQLGTNHLGHFALTLQLLPLLERAAAPRVVTVSSNMHRRGQLRFDDLMGERSYSAWGAYSNSKLANLLFTYELERRLAAAGKKTMSVAAHPGYAATNLQHNTGSRVMVFLMGIGNVLLAQSADRGALPQLYAATASDVKAGEYFGPGGLMEMQGFPRRVDSSARSKDVVAAAELWSVSERLTGSTLPA